MHDLIPAVVSSILLIALAIGFYLRDRARRLERKQELKRMGFRPSPEQSEELVEIVTAVENNSTYWYSVDHPMRSIVVGRRCYFYTKLRMRRTRVDALEEFLVSLARPSKEGLLLLVETSRLPFRSVEQWSEALHPGVPQWYPRDLTPLDLLDGVETDGVMAAFGPSGAALPDLIDIQMFDGIRGVGELGVSTVTFRGDWCSFSAGSARTTLSMAGLLSLFERLSDS